MRRCFAALLSLLTLVSVAGAQDYPSRPIHLLVGFPPGGGVDIVARQLADQLSAQMGQRVVVENRPGAGGNIASEVVSRAAPDGYTLLMSNLGMLAINPALYPRLGFEPDKSFAPIALTVMTPLVAAVPASLPAKTFQEFLALELNYGSGGIGNVNHLAVELLKLKTGSKIEHVPFRGSAPALTELVAGRIHLVVDGANVVQPFIDAGTIRGLAVTSEARTGAMPNLPTAAEAGLGDFVITGWQGVVAPAGTPAAVLDRLQREVEKALATPALRDRLSRQGTEPSFLGAMEFAKFIASERTRWAEVVQASGAKIE
jgi:tripartite-type tricarboxylate transporter receptor subunit TctC